MLNNVMQHIHWRDVSVLVRFGEYYSISIYSALNYDLSVYYFAVTIGIRKIQIQLVFLNCLSIH